MAPLIGARMFFSTGLLAVVNYNLNPPIVKSNNTKDPLENTENKALCVQLYTSSFQRVSLPSHSLCLYRPRSLSLPCNWQAAVTEVNSTAAILMPSTPTFCQLELLAVSDDGAIKRDVRGPSDRWIHAFLCLNKTCPPLRPQLTRLTSTYSCGTLNMQQGGRK